MPGAIPPFPQYAFMAWCSVTAQGLYLTFAFSGSIFNYGNRGWIIRTPGYTCSRNGTLTITWDFVAPTVMAKRFLICTSTVSFIFFFFFLLLIIKDQELCLLIYSSPKLNNPPLRRTVQISSYRSVIKIDHLSKFQCDILTFLLIFSILFFKRLIHTFHFFSCVSFSWINEAWVHRAACFSMFQEFHLRNLYIAAKCGCVRASFS